MGHAEAMKGNEAWEGALAQYLPLETLLAHFVRNQESLSTSDVVELQRLHNVASEETSPGSSAEPVASVPSTAPRDGSPSGSSGVAESSSPSKSFAPVPVSGAGPIGLSPSVDPFVSGEGRPEGDSDFVVPKRRRRKKKLKTDEALKLTKMADNQAKLTKSQKKNQRKKANKAKGEQPGRKVYTAYVNKPDGFVSGGVLDVGYDAFPDLPANQATWIVHSVRVKYIDAAASPAGIVTVACGGRSIADQAGKSPNLWSNTPTARVPVASPATSVRVTRAGGGEGAWSFVLEVSITVTTMPV